MSVDVYNNPDVQYDSYLEPELPVFAQQILTQTAITNINGLTGPTITLAGGSSGFSYSPAGATITLVSPITTKGDLYTWSTVGTRLGVGADAQVLTADSTQLTGLKWATPTTGTVTTVSVVSANGFAGTVANATTTPAITLTTTVNAPALAGNGTAISAATTTGSGSTVVLSTTPTFTTSIKTPAITVPSDGTTALQVFKADGSTQVLIVDTTNTRLGVGVAPSVTLHGLDEIACTSAGTPIISCGLNTTNGGAAVRLRGASSGNNNWQMANNYNGGYFEITPSTAAGGNTYTTPAMVISNSSFVGIGITAPKSKLHIEGASGWIIADEQDTDPTSTELDSLDSMAIYMKNDKFVIAFNNAGTITYIKIPMDGSTTTWTQDTSAP